MVVGFAENACVRHAVQRDAAGQAQIAAFVLFRERPNDVQNGFLDGVLKRVSEVAVTTFDRFAFLASRTEGLDKALLEGPVETVGVVVDEVPVDGEFSLGTEMNEFTKFFRVGVVSGRGERHDRSFLEIIEPEMLGDGGVEHAEGIEDVVLRDPLDAIAKAGICRLSRLIAIAVHHQDGRFVEGRHEEGGGVRIVVTHLHDLRQFALGAEVPKQAPPQAIRHGDDERGLGRPGARRNEIETGGKAIANGAKHHPPQRSHVPWRGDHIDLGEAQASIVDGDLE